MIAFDWIAGVRAALCYLVGYAVATRRERQRWTKAIEWHLAAQHEPTNEEQGK